MAMRNILKLQPLHRCVRNASILQNTVRHTALVSNAEETGNNELKIKVVKGLKANVEKMRARAEFMEQQEHEFEIGRRHLANMMGEDPEFFLQEDINRAIEYLLPSGLFDKKARPSMKPPKQVFAQEKEAQFDLQGSPFHPFFYTVLPKYYENLHKISSMIKALDHLENTARAANEKPLHMEMNITGTRWINLTEFTKLLDEKYNDDHHSFFIQSLEHLLEHTYAYREKDFIEQFRKPIDVKVQEEIAQLMHTEDGTPYMTHRTRHNTSVADVTVFGRGTGKIEINGKDLLYFPEIQNREQITFPLIFTDLVDAVDIVVKIENGGSTGQAHAIRHALSMSLASFVDDDMRTRMKIAGLLQRDIRYRERKKFGQKGPRAKYTWKRR